MALIEPIILIVMGVVVAFVLISLYLPIFSIGAGGNQINRHLAISTCISKARRMS